MVTFTGHEKTIIRLEANQRAFVISDDISEYPRACIEIDNACPGPLAEAIIEATRNGWVKPIAYIRKQELMWGDLSTK
jgi:hypothetical protein